MLHPDPTCRLSMREISVHPFFWDVSKRLQFLVDVSDKLEKEESASPLCHLIDSNVIIYSHSIIDSETIKPSSIISGSLSSSSLNSSNMSRIQTHIVHFSAFDVIGGNWERRISSLLVENLRTFRKYKADSVRDLLRVIRNKRNHFEDFTDELKEMVFLLSNNYFFFFFLILGGFNSRRFFELFYNSISKTSNLCMANNSGNSN
jgi:serine/threonine-protein kinase/endoribonuclease IRE1